MTFRSWSIAWAAIAVLAAPASAQFGSPQASGFTPRVPVSGLAVPSIGFDPSRLHLSTSVTFGSFGQSVSGLQVTSLQYQFRQPFSLGVSLGNVMGGKNGFGRGNSFFLEGLNLTYRPSASMFFHIAYQDLRSPYQLSGRNSPFSPDGTAWGR